ncbi:MAG: FG-GAP repeat protein [bacterium ADurb.Bin212]|nr:MAG: FG-GAP repeat protein [bacterium ADurb.Bin212]
MIRNYLAHMKLSTLNKRNSFRLIRYVFYFASVLMFLCIFTGGQKALAVDTSVANFNSTAAYNNLISDDAFIATKSMSVSDIQSFLELKGSYLAGYSENGRTAAQIIYDAALALTPDSQSAKFNAIPAIDPSTGTVSPRVILVVLDKEQSLISGKFRLPGQGDFTNTEALNYALTWAMGYGCPDAGSWDNSKAGFSKQVDWGAWQLRYNWYRAQGYGFLDYQVGQTVTYSNWYGTYNVTYNNRATSSLYRYTPHVFNGNYNFWRLYKLYFSSQVVINVSPGGKVKIESNGTYTYCQDRCYLQYPANTTIDFYALGNEDAVFYSWDGCNSSVSKCGFLFSDGKTVNCNFKQSVTTEGLWTSAPGAWDATRSRSLVSGDFDNDGDTDIATLYEYPGQIARLWMFKNNGDSTFTPNLLWTSAPGAWDATRSRSLVSGDFDNDGDTDIATLYEYPGQTMRMWVFTNTGSTMSPKNWYFSGNGRWDAKRSMPLTFIDNTFSENGRLVTIYNYPGHTSSLASFAPTGYAHTKK